MPQRLVFNAHRQVACIPFNLPALAAGQVRVRALCSLISTGTEGIVFNRLFEAGSHWDKWIKYPFHPGYSLIAEVESIADDVTTLKIGDRVAVRAGHMSHLICPATECILVPTGLDPRAAAWFALAKITFMGARAASLSLGDDVLIIGAGPIGQMVTRWVRTTGARSIVVADQLPERLALARRGGATATIAKPIDDAQAELMQACGGRKPRIVIDSTGNAKVFSAALAAARDRGKVVLMGDTGSPSEQRLTSDVILRGVSVVGAHDCHNDSEWYDATIVSLFFQMVADARFDVGGLQSHTFAPSDCVAAYDLISTRRAETMGVLFNWSDVQ